MDGGQTAAAARPVTLWVWIGTVVVLALAWAGLLLGWANQAYVLVLVLLTVWLPAFAWWLGRRMRPASPKA